MKYSTKLRKRLLAQIKLINEKYPELKIHVFNINTGIINRSFAKDVTCEYCLREIMNSDEEITTNEALENHHKVKSVTWFKCNHPKLIKLQRKYEFI